MHLCEFRPLGCRTAANRLTVETRSGPRSRLRRALSLANEEHVARLKQGVEAWNAWRHENPDIIQPSLIGASLVGANLVVANLFAANLAALGRFTEDRKTVLDAIRDELRNRGYLPILFDFEK